MELILIAPSGQRCTVPLDGIAYSLVGVNPNFAESVSKTYSLPIEIPARLFPARVLGALMAPGGKYEHNTLPGYLSDGGISRPCTVKFEQDQGDVIQLSIDYADLPVDMLSRKIAEMDLGTWSFDQPLSTWAQTARDTTGALISFPMIYAPQYFKENHDDQFLGDTDYINLKTVEHHDNGSPWLRMKPIHIYIYDDQHPEDAELHNDNAVIPCVHLVTLLSRICALSGYTLDRNAFPEYFGQIYLSTLKYPELPEPVSTDVVQSGANPGNKEPALGDTNRDGYDWVYFEQYFDLPKQLSGCTVTVTLNSGTLFPCRDMNQEQPYGKHVATDFKCVIDNIAEYGLELEDTLVREVIEDEVDLDKSEVKFTFQFVRTRRANGYARPRIQLRGSNIHDGKVYPAAVRPPYVEDLQATISYAFDREKTYEIFMRPKDYSSYVQVRTADFLDFETFSDLYTSLKNAFGLSLLPDTYSRTITPHASSQAPRIHDLQEYSPDHPIRSYNDTSLFEEKAVVVKSPRQDSPVIVISPSLGVTIYRDQAAYQSRNNADGTTETIKDTALFPLKEKRRMAAFDSQGSGKNNIFFAPLAVVEGVELPEPMEAITKIERDGKTITLELDSLYETALKYILNSVYTKEPYEIQTYIPADKLLSIDSQDKVYICNRLFDIVEMQADSAGEGFVVTFSFLG